MILQYFSVNASSSQLPLKQCNRPLNDPQKENNKTVENGNSQKKNIAVEKKKKKQPYKCPTCDNSYKQSFSLTRHLENGCQSQMERHFKCFYCDYMALYPINVLRHCTNVHKREKPRYIDTNTGKEIFFSQLIFMSN